MRGSIAGDADFEDSFFHVEVEVQWWGGQQEYLQIYQRLFEFRIVSINKGMEWGTNG